MYSLNQYRYKLLPNNFTRKASEHRIYHSVSAILLIFTGILCFNLGRVSKDYSLAKTEPSLRLVEITFQYERLFGSRPSPESDYAWLHLFPSGAGFFNHPTLATKRSAFSTFHQLHCLDGLRHGYWELYDANVSGKKLNETEIPLMTRPPHIRHCIDLLRQALMCRPDLTIEEKDEELGGVSGFGTTHQCHDWDQLVSWTRKWQDWGVDKNQDSERVVQSHSHHHGQSHEMMSEESG